ncbi:MAG: 6,7-dimethyl-8-ribityllumazine synthase [Deltaproteobacteria bacterium]|nr:6,7-dimethyl-8-ribityllumazine synthase [Deltaproteobacteria bacterium]
MSRYIAKRVTGLKADGLRFGIVVSRFNEKVTTRLLSGAKRGLKKAKRLDVVWVPGAFEIPYALMRMARQKKYDALIALGAVIRGGTPHFDYVAGETARGVMQVMLQEKIPVAFGVLTTNNLKQALDRSGGRLGNKGIEAAEVAIEMVRGIHHGLSS